VLSVFFSAVPEEFLEVAPAGPSSKQRPEFSLPERCAYVEVTQVGRTQLRQRMFMPGDDDLLAAGGVRQQLG